MKEDADLDLKRVQALTDATFAVAMTLLILEVKVPEGLSASQIINYFFEVLLSDFFIYIIGFITLGIFWIGSHFQHSTISRIDKFSSWLNIFFLMTICIIPFSVSVIKNYRNEKLSIIFYCIVLIMASSINLIMLWYAWKKKHTKEQYTSIHFRNARIRILIPIFIYMGIIVVAFFSTRISLVLFLAPLILHIIPENYFRLHAGNPSAE